VAEELKRGKQILAIKLEIATWDAMEKGGCGFLKEQTDNCSTQTMREITDNLEANLICKDEPKLEICGAKHFPCIGNPPP
jgi:hypothetical protein